MHKYNLISILVPVFSVLIIVSAVIFLKPDVTGLVIHEPGAIPQNVNADVTLKTKSNEVIPPNAIIEVQLDENKAGMYIKEFIEKTGKDYKIETGALEEFGFYGPGYTGDYIYSMELSEFDIDREIGVGEHIFTTRIIYRNQILYEKENRIMIAE